MVSSARMIIGRTNALDISGRTARRYEVLSCIVRDGTVESAKLAEELAEEIALPLTRTSAMIYVHRYFEDFDGERMRDLVEKLSRPTGELNGRRTDPMA